MKTPSNFKSHNADLTLSANGRCDRRSYPRLAASRDRRELGSISRVLTHVLDLMADGTLALEEDQT